MANFATDKNLLAYEPRVFIDVPLVGQEVLRVTDGVIAGLSLTSATGGFSNLTDSHIVTISSSAADPGSSAIASVEDDNTLTLACRLPSLAASSGLTVSVRTFEPQITQVHAEILTALGIDANDPTLPLTDAAIVSTALVERIESLGALWRAYEAGVGVSSSSDALASKAEEYRKRYIAAMSSARVLIDIDGDGKADCWRSPAVGHLVRA